ncbi:hypothetical protein B0J11DRAFT_542956 [Dendryphion nanum]|uniref:Uncharacterized protein n=1 Tax=Dendryphion nanum TaxID=256645 RepID=A0A9P9D3J1_9PLEO|nr:hypothetical protein B0J11DRAFT_542956 [Dendryphion nanum]
MLRLLPMVVSFAFTIAALTCTAFSFCILLKSESQMSGLLVVIVSSSTLHPRSKLNKRSSTYLPYIFEILRFHSRAINIQGRANIFDTVHSKLQRVASLAATAVPSAVTNALDEIKPW